MDRISRLSRGKESVRFGDLRIASLLFADYVVLLATSDRDLQHALEQFAAKREAVRMRVSTSKSEAMVLCRKTVECSLRVGSELLPQAKEFKYLGVLFTSEGKMGAGDGQTDWCGVCSNASAVPVRCGEEGAEPKGLYISCGLGSWRVLLGRRKPGGPCLAGCHCNPAPVKQKKMDGWNEFHNC